MADWASDLGHWVLGSEPSRERKGHQDMVLARLEMDMELGTALGKVRQEMVVIRAVHPCQEGFPCRYQGPQSP
jgi:hypothetical protein